jgi:hypothetical protein
MKDESRKWILVKGNAGMGNRILSLLTASLFAVVAKRQLLIDWRDPTYTGRSDAAPDLFRELFYSPLADPLPDHIEARSVAPAIWADRLDVPIDIFGIEQDPQFHKKFWSFRKLAVSLRRLDYAEEILVFWSWREVMRPLRRYLNEFDGRYHTMSNASILKDAVKQYLQPNDRINSIVSQFASKHMQGRILGLHIRATDLTAPVEKLLYVARRISRQQDCCGVFCATDNSDVEDRVRQMIPNVVTFPKQFTKAAVPLHYDPDCKDRVQRATQALVDMLLLSKCSTLVYASRSSFGYVASLFATHEQALVDVDRFNPKIQAKQWLQSWIY